jgi:putative oxidoreductase
MTQTLGRFSAQLYALLRIVAGLMYMMHGAQKLFGAFGQEAVPVGTLIGAAGVIEFVCGALVLIGLFGSIAAFIASGEMAVAYFLAHATKSFWPIVNQGELAVLYCFVFLYVAANGSGLWSLDALLARRHLHPPGEPHAV